MVSVVQSTLHTRGCVYFLNVMFDQNVSFFRGIETKQIGHSHIKKRYVTNNLHYVFYATFAVFQ